MPEPWAYPVYAVGPAYPVAAHAWHAARRAADDAARRAAELRRRRAAAETPLGRAGFRRAGFCADEWCVVTRDGARLPLPVPLPYDRARMQEMTVVYGRQHGVAVRL